MKNRTNGFTLLEVMVALAVFAVVSVAVIRTAVRTVDQTIGLQDRIQAQWIAENQLNEIRALERSPENYPPTRTRVFDVTQAGRTWQVTLAVKNTENEDIRRIEIEVADEDAPDYTISRLVGFVGKY